jgi:anaerobic C4-dicarboxylate transporter
MDRFTSKLREDAASIDAEISAQLDSRIQASLNAIEPEVSRQRKRPRRPVSFWLASSLTGITAALAVIAVLNMIDSNEPASVPQVVVGNAAPQVRIPALDLEVEAAMLASPLTQELEDLQADLKKAEELVRGDVRIDF